MTYFDVDNDGKTTVSDIFYIVRMVVYLGLAGYAIIMEGMSPTEDVYTDFELITIIVASFGSGMMDTFIRAKFRSNEV